MGKAIRKWILWKEEEVENKSFDGNGGKTVMRIEWISEEGWRENEGFVRQYNKWDWDTERFYKLN